MALIHLVRYPIFGIILFCSIIVLGIDANLTSLSNGDITSAALGVAISVITLITIPAMVVIDILRSSAVTSFVWAELAWVGILGVLWLATAADFSSLGITDCGDIYFSAFWESLCRQAQAAEAFSWIAWIALLTYWSMLLASARLDQSKGNGNIWFTAVREAQFSGTSSPAIPAVVEPPVALQEAKAPTETV